MRGSELVGRHIPGGTGRVRLWLRNSNLPRGIPVLFEAIADVDDRDTDRKDHETLDHTLGRTPRNLTPFRLHEQR